MKVKEVDEAEMASIIAHAVEIYGHEVFMSYPDMPSRSSLKFAKDYVAMLYSTTETKDKEPCQKE